MDEKWAAYRDALIALEAPGGTTWVAPAPATWADGAYPAPEGRVICVVTAYNPGGQTVSGEENAEAQEQLERELTRRGWTWWRAAGGDPAWEHVELSAAVVGVEESLVASLAADFGQDAIFVLTPADRRVVDCRSGLEISTGWSITMERPGRAKKEVCPPASGAVTEPDLAADEAEPEQA